MPRRGNAEGTGEVGTKLTHRRFPMDATALLLSRLQFAYHHLVPHHLSGLHNRVGGLAYRS